MSASSAESRNKASVGSLKEFLAAYASLPFRHHLMVSIAFAAILGGVKFLISISQPEGIWWDALNTINLFVVLSTLMYGAIFFSQVMASVCARTLQALFGESACAAGSVIGVLLSAVMILLLAPYLLDLIWR